MIDLATTTRRHLRIDEVMELFRVSRRTVYYWVETKKIPAEDVEGKIRIDVNGLRELVARCPLTIGPNSLVRAAIAQRSASPS